MSHVIGKLDCSCAEEVVVDMIHDKGMAFVNQWSPLVMKLKLKKWEEAAKLMESSDYCRRDQSRCKRNTDQMRKC